MSFFHRNKKEEREHMSMDEDANSSEEEGAGFQGPPDTEAKC